MMLPHTLLDDIREQKSAGKNYVTVFRPKMKNLINVKMSKK